MADTGKIYSFLRSFSAGVDSNKSPLDLPVNQLAFASNCSMRGDFVKQRPNFFNLALVDNTGGLFQSGIFQGATYYRGADGLIMVAAGGNLFQMAISGNTATVTRVNSNTLQQSATATAQWMWQAENFLIWSDGINLPVFWDGSSNIRRSVGNNLTAISATTADLTVPAVGATVSVPVSTNIPTGEIAPNTACLIGASQFQFVSCTQSSTNASVSLVTTILQSLAAGTDYLISSSTVQTVLYENNTYPGWILNGGVIQKSVVISNWQNIAAYAAQSITVNFLGSAIASGGVVVGATCTINGNQCTVTAVTTLSGQITQLIVSPVSNTPWTVTGNFVSGTHTVPDSGLPSWSSPQATSALAVPFTVQLNQAPWGITGKQAFNVFDSNNKAVTFTGTVTTGSSTITNCAMANPPNFSSPIQTFATGAFPTALNQFVTGGWTASTTSVGSVYNYNGNTYSNVTIPASGSLTIPVQLGVSVAAGTVLQATTGDGNTALFLVTSYSGTASSSQLYATFINQTAVVGSTIQAGSGIVAVPEIPVCAMGAYGMGRNWISIPDGSGKFTEFLATDLVGGVSGTSNYNFKDAVLKTSQNAFLAGGGTFTIPNSGETITAMQFVASLDASLGQGFLQVFTDSTVFSCNAPTDITTWASVTTPILTESMIGNGACSQDAAVQVNNDLLFRLYDGGVQSLTLARLDFNKWGNTPISTEVTTSLQNDAQALLQYCSSEVFSNRLLQLCQPSQQARGVVHASLVALNFDPISSLRGKEPSIWEGQWENINGLKTVCGVFGGVRRCFVLTLNSGQIGLMEILLDTAATQDNGNVPVNWHFDSPMIFERDNKARSYLRLADGEIYLQNITAPVTITAYYKPDQNAVWTKWYQTTITPVTGDSGYRPRVGLGQPNPKVFDPSNNKPMREGYDFQVQLKITGACTFLGGRFAADTIPQPEFSKPI
jgi:hypothetical protein